MHSQYTTVLLRLMSLFHLARSLRPSTRLQSRPLGTSFAFTTTNPFFNTKGHQQQHQQLLLSTTTSAVGCVSRLDGGFEQSRLCGSKLFSTSTPADEVATATAEEISDTNEYEYNGEEVVGGGVDAGNEQFHSTSSIILDGLNPSQVEAVTQPNSAVTRVIAGPGSGKTKVLTCRIAHLLENDRHSRILAVTFTRKAAGEMQQRVETLLRERQKIENEINGDVYGKEYIYDENGSVVEETDSAVPRGLERVTLGTFHSVCSKILRYNGDLLATLPSVLQTVADRPDAIVNLDGNFAIIDQTDQIRIVKECLEEAKIDLKKSSIKPLAILSAISKIKEDLSQGIDPFRREDKNKPLPLTKKFAQQIYSLYREKIFTNNAVDFDDLIFMTRELLLREKELRRRLHNRWPHILVDEFQDTSRSQMDLVKLLTSSSLFVVGDSDQSIYSWRGAHVGSLSDFAVEFNRHANGVSTVYLKENYRSTANIVRAAEKVISSSGGKMTPNNDIRRAMKPKRGSGPSPRVVACFNEKAEANFVVDTIFGMIGDGKIKTEDKVSIIYRTNAQSRHLEEACVQKNLPYVIRGGAGGFYKRAEVKDCLCFLRWLHNGNDEGAMLRAMKTPSKGIGEVAVDEFREYCSIVAAHYKEYYPDLKRVNPLDILISLTDEEFASYSLVDDAPEASVFISKRALNKFIPFSLQMRSIRNKAKTAPVDALLFFLIEELDLISHFDSISKSKAEFEERQENVQELRQATKRYSTYGVALGEKQVTDDEFQNESALGIFLDDVALVTDITGDSGNDDSRLVINLMTIHASKGMEFDTVFVVGNEEGTLPSNLALQEGEGSVPLEEEKRLCYVAMTRAKTNLIMTWRKEVSNFSSWSDDGPRTAKKDRSRFLDAIVSRKGKNSKTVSGKRAKTAPPKDVDQMLRRRSSTMRSPSSQVRRTAPTTTRRPTSPGRSSPPGRSSSFEPPQRPVSTSVQRKPQVAPPMKRQPSGNGNRAPSVSRSNMAPNTGNPNRRIQPNPRQNREAGIQRRDRFDQQPEKVANSARATQPVAFSPRTQNSRDFGTQRRVQPQRTISPPIPRNPNGTSASNTARSPPRTVQGEQRQRRPQSTVSNPRKKAPPAQKPASDFDSTWFFPIGSEVVHQTFGKGVVLDPPKDARESTVRVDFGSGRTEDFPVIGDDITPFFG